MKTSQTIPVIFYEEGTCSLGSLITSVWLEKPFRVCRLEEDDDQTPDYLTLNGMGQVPVVYEDGVIITENVAVLHHLAARDPSKKIDFPADTPQYDQLNRALGFLASEFHKAFGGVFMPDVFHTDKKVQKEIKERMIKGHLHDVITHAERHLFDAQSPFLFNHPTIVDAYLFAMLRWTKGIYDLEKEFPNLKRFQDAMKKDAGVQFATEIEKGKVTEERDFFKGAVEFKSFVKEAASAKKSADKGKEQPGLKRSVLSDGEEKQTKQL